MAEEENNNQLHKCPFCSCIFLTKVDLQKHMKRFGNYKDDHLFVYKKTHGRVEYGSYEE